MLTLRFSGWVSCRLATDPDPFDDPRGNLSSFRQLAYAGEPDLDRTIYFQNPPFVRAHCWPIGVSVKSVARGAAAIDSHPLTGAAVDLLDNPALEGRNHVISFDQNEPIFPFHLQLSKRAAAVSRRAVPKNADYPFPEFFPVPGGVNQSEVFSATGISDLRAAWQARLLLLAAGLEAAGEEEKPALEERIAMLQTGLAQGFLAVRAFGFSMRWRYALNGPVAGNTSGLFASPVDNDLPWVADFWFGGFDADAQSFYCSGTLEVPETGEQAVVTSATPSRRATPFRV